MRKCYNRIEPERTGWGKLEESEVALSRGKANKNPNGAGTIRRRPGGRWEGRYSNGFDKDGKQIQKSIYGATQQEVRQKLAKVVTEIDDGTYIEPSKMKLSEWPERVAGSLAEGVLRRQKVFDRQELSCQRQDAHQASARQYSAWKTYQDGYSAVL